MIGGTMKKIIVIGIILFIPLLCFSRSGTKSTNTIQTVEVPKEVPYYTYYDITNTRTISVEKFIIEGVEIVGDTKTGTIKVLGIDTTSIVTTGNTITVKPKKIVEPKIIVEPEK